MSKNFFQQRSTTLKRTLNVDAGYDRPMRHYYLNVTGPDGKQVYVSMYDQALSGPERRDLRYGLSVDELAAKLTNLGLTPPPGLLEALEDQGRRQAGNEIRHF